MPTNKAMEQTFTPAALARLAFADHRTRPTSGSSQGSTTTDAQYQRALAQFRMKGSASAKRFFTHFCSGCSLQGLSSGRIVAIQTEFCTFDSCKMEGSGDTARKLCELTHDRNLFG